MVSLIDIAPLVYQNYHRVVVRAHIRLACLNRREIRHH